MLKIGVCQGKEEFLDRVLRASFDEAGMDVKILCGNNLDTDICVLATCGELQKTSAKIVIVPDSKTFPSISASEVITYGLCCKNTLTVSSCIESDLVLSLQRTLVTHNGLRIEEQDFPVKLTDPDEPELILAAVATLLAADVPISVISSLPF